MRQLFLALIFSLFLFLGIPGRVSAAGQSCVPYLPISAGPQCPTGETCVSDASGNYTCAPSQVDQWDAGKCYTKETVKINGVDKEVKVATLQGFGCIFRNVLGIIVPLLGLVLFVLLLAGGFQYITAGGDPKQTQKASGTITTAIIGIVVVVGAWFIFKILNAITGLDLLNFLIPG